MPNTLARLIPDRQFTAVTGADAFALFARIITIDLDPDDEQLRFGGLLSPQGKILADFFIWPRRLASALGGPSDTAFVLETAIEQTDDITKRLSMYRLRADVGFVPMGIHPVGADQVAGAGALSLADPRAASLGRTLFRTIAPKAKPSAPDWPMPALLCGWDFAPDQYYPTEVNWDLLAAIDYRKGCFVGQEVASRMKRLGGLRKRALWARGGEALALTSDLPVHAEGMVIGKLFGLVGSAPQAPALIDLTRLNTAQLRSLSSAGGLVAHIDAGPISLHAESSQLPG